MIKVNLLRDHIVRVHSKSLKPAASRAGWVFLGFFALLACALGGTWLFINNQIQTLTGTRDTLRIENEKLQALKKQINEFEKLKKLRQGRIDVIEKLKESQSSPVLLLNHVIRSVPHDSVWLTLMDQKGDRIRVTGHALRIEAISDFMTNLSSTGFFSLVDLELIEAEKDSAKFSLLCTTAHKVLTE